MMDAKSSAAVSSPESSVFRTQDPALPSGVVEVGARRTRARISAGALDALVRALRAHQPGMEPLMERCWEILHQPPTAKLEIGAATCSIDGETALEADAERGRWLLPAFMAGLRSLTVEPDSRPADVLALAQALSTLKLVPSQLGQFADWIWSDGLEGVHAELHTSFAEILEIPDDPARQVAEIRAVRSDMADALASAHRVTTRDLDAAAVLAEFQAPLDTFARQAHAGNLALLQPEMDALRVRAEDTAFWVRQEITLALAHPELRSSMSPRSLARQLVRVAGESFAQFLTLCSALAGHPDAYAQAVIHALEDEPVGKTIAARTPLDRNGAMQLAQVLRGQSAKLAAGVVHGLIERAAREGAEAEQFAARMAAVVGEAVWCGHLDPNLVPASARPAMARIVAVARFSPPQLGRILGLLRPAEAIAALAHIPADTLTGLDEALLSLLADASARERATLVVPLLEHSRPATLARLVALLAESRAEGWDLRTIRLIAQAAIPHGQGEALLHLQRSSTVPIVIRLALLEALAHAPETAEPALRWRAAELLDASEMRERLSALRKVAKS
jgi:hypothetical protein